MKAYEISEQQGLTSLRAVHRADPSVKAGHVLVQVRAVCLNHRELKFVSGSDGALKPQHQVPVSDGLGHVGAFSPAAFGADLGITLDGWLAERIAVPASARVRLPDDDAAQAYAALASGAQVGKVLIRMPEAG